jgi:hypothetical protein
MNTDAPISTFDAWLEQASIPALERDLNAMRMKFHGKIAAYEKLAEELSELDQEIDRRSRVLTVLREIRPEESEASPSTSGGEPSEQTTMTKREMAERILRGAVRSMFPREVRDIAVERGWLPDEANAANQLSVAMNRAARTGKLARDEEGRYSLPKEPTEPAPEPHGSGDPGDLLFPTEMEEGESP